jgi:hypothetical protein
VAKTARLHRIRRGSDLRERQQSPVSSACPAEVAVAPSGALRATWSSLLLGASLFFTSVITRVGLCRLTHRRPTLQLSKPPTSPLAPHDGGRKAHGGRDALQHLDHLQGGGHGLRSAALVVQRCPRRGGGGSRRQSAQRCLHRRRVSAACACVASTATSHSCSCRGRQICTDRTRPPLTFAVRHPSPLG